MTAHAKDALAGARISQVLNLPLTIPAFEACCAESLITRQDSEIFDFVSTGAAAVGAVVADEGSIAEQKQVGIRVE